MKEKNNPLLSIIVPMYNSEKFISDCIESILNQDFKDYELILVDDCSTDDTLKICQLYAEKDQRIVILESQHNGGAIAARKAGVMAARAEFIGFVDSDDWIESDMYSSLMRIQSENDCDLVSSGIFRDYIEDGYTLETVDNFPQGIYYDLPQSIYNTMLYDKQKCDSGILCTLANKLFKRKILVSVYNEIDMRVFYGEDTLALFAYIMKIENIYILREMFYHYNIRKGSVCRNNDERLGINTYYLYKGLEKIFLAQNEYKYVLLRQLRKYILGIETHTLEQLYNISIFSLGSYKYNYDDLKQKKIVIYGAGNSSESLYKYLIEGCNCSIVAWVDKFPAGKNLKVLHEVLPVESIVGLQYDYIVIAVVKETLAERIKKELVDVYNINEKKILWKKVEYSSVLSNI